MKRGIRWGRVIAAAVLSEVGVILILLAVITVYRYLISPGMTSARYQEFGAHAGYYVAPVACGFTVFLMVLWMARGLTADFAANGTLVGVAAVILTAGFLLSAKPEDRLMYVISFAIRIVAGYLGGMAAHAAYQRRAAGAPVGRREVA
jgi:hypothetical protein